MNKPQCHNNIRSQSRVFKVVLACLGMDPSRHERCRLDPGTAHFPGALSGGIGAGIADATRRAAPALRAVGGSDLDWNSSCCHSRGNCVVAVVPSLMSGAGVGH